MKIMLIFFYNLASRQLMSGSADVFKMINRDELSQTHRPLAIVLLLGGLFGALFSSPLSLASLWEYLAFSTPPRNQPRPPILYP